MGGNYLIFTTVYTVISLIGLSWRMNSALKNIALDSSILEKGGSTGQATYLLELLLSSYVTVALLANFVLNIFILVTLCLKIVFFGQLSSIETRKVVERLINYVVYKGIFLPLVVQPDIFQSALWLIWFSVLCFLKMFQALARDRLDRLNASPSATPWTYFRVFSVLLWVLSVDFFWIRMCWMIFRTSGSSIFLLLLFEPLSIAFETTQAIMVHGFQLIDTWHCNSMDSNGDCQCRIFDRSAAGSLWEWKGILIRNCGFFMELMTLLMALGHYLHIWWLHGMSFHLVDAVLLLNSRALVSAIIKRIKGFIKLKKALSTLQGALPDATSEELREYNDECAICREPMARAKRLSCNHLFHLSCLRSWLDQGQNEMYSCPTCRRPLFVASNADYTNSITEQVLDDEQLARQMSLGMDHRTISGHGVPTGAFPNQQASPSGSSVWRGTGLDSTWPHPWPGTGLDGAGPSTMMSSVGFGRVQMMMRHLASLGETYAHTALEDASWNLWPMAHPQSGPSSSIPPVRHNGNTSGIRFRNPSSSVNQNMSRILAMADTVREVFPHIPDEIIFQDLQRTNSVTVTVNNLLQI